MKPISTPVPHKSTNAKKVIIFCIAAGLLLLLASVSQAQVLVTLNKETFPNSDNTGLTAPVNKNFSGSTGSWASYSTGAATVASLPAYYSPVTNALKITHWSTSGSGAADSYATSPVANLANAGCNSKYDFSFKLYTYNVVSGDNNAYLAVEFSTDGGNNWTTVWQKTSGQLYSTYGLNGIAEIWLAFPPTYFSANFKYRFRGHMNANNPNTFFVFADDATIYAYACSDMMSVGDQVWLDLNQNGSKEAGEAGIPGVSVQIEKDNNGDGINDGDFSPQTAITDINGKYKFTNLTAGKYKLELLNISNLHRLVAANAGEPDEDADNNNNGLFQNGSFEYVNGGWITLLPQSEPINDGDGSNGNMTYDFAIYPSNALPVQGISTNVLLAANTVTVNWNTLGEVNTSVFEVERSTDNSSFIKMGSKSSTAVYGGNAAYSFNDDITAVTAAAVYYRIKAIDKDGKFTYSNIVAVKLAQQHNISVWPNPFVADIKISHTAAAAGNLIVTVSDASGKLIVNKSSKIVKGNNQIVIGNLANIANGLYIIDVLDAKSNVRYTTKLIK